MRGSRPYAPNMKEELKDYLEMAPWAEVLDIPLDVSGFGSIPEILTAFIN
jgi:hypothetical protein